MRKPRDYIRERKTESKARKKQRAERNKARRMAIKAGMIKPGSKMQIDHRIHLDDGGSNGYTNIRVRSPHANMSDNGHAGGRPKKKRKKRK